MNGENAARRQGREVRKFSALAAEANSGWRRIVCVAWTCPECGARFVTRNLSHSCVRRTVNEFFAGKPAAGVAHAKAFIAEARKPGRDSSEDCEISDRRPIDDELRTFLSMSYAIGRREHIVPKRRRAVDSPS